MGEGLCVYLVDPSISGWDRDFAVGGPLGFRGGSHIAGRRGVVVGIAIDLTGSFCAEPNQVAIKSAAGVILYQCDFPYSAITSPGEWRDVSIKFGVDSSSCDMSIGGKEVFAGVRLAGVCIPRTACIGVCASASATHHAFISVNNISLLDDPNDHQSAADVCGDVYGELLDSKLKDRIEKLAAKSVEKPRLIEMVRTKKKDDEKYSFLHGGEGAATYYTRPERSLCLHHSSWSYTHLRDTRQL